MGSKPAAQDQKPAMLKVEVDTDTDPKLGFDETKIKKHEKGGKVIIERRGDELFVGGKKVILHRSDSQQNGKKISGRELIKELTGKPVLNACVLDFLLENVAFIPDSWKKKRDRFATIVLFSGTIYCTPGGDLYVRGFCWNGAAWSEHCVWLDHGPIHDHPAALLAS